VDWRAALSPGVGHIGPNWVTILVCLFLSFIAYLYCFDYACGVALHLGLGLFFVVVAWRHFIHSLPLPLLHTSLLFIGVILSEFTTETI